MKMNKLHLKVENVIKVFVSEVFAFAALVLWKSGAMIAEDGQSLFRKWGFCLGIWIDLQEIMC